MIQTNYSPSFAQGTSIISQPKAPKSRNEIFDEKVAKDAEKAKQKSIKDRNVSEHISVGIDTINKITDNAPVVHANSPNKLNYLV